MPEMYSPAGYPPQDWPEELVEHPLSYGLASGKFGCGYLPHVNSAASDSEELWPEHCR